MNLRNVSFGEIIIIRIWVDLPQKKKKEKKKIKLSLNKHNNYNHLSVLWVHIVCVVHQEMSTAKIIWYQCLSSRCQLRECQLRAFKDKSHAETFPVMEKEWENNQMLMKHALRESNSIFHFKEANEATRVHFSVVTGRGRPIYVLTVLHKKTIWYILVPKDP